MKQMDGEWDQSGEPISVGELSAVITSLLTSPRLEGIDLDERLLADEEFKRLYSVIMDLRTLAGALSKGDLSKTAASRGYLVSSLKSLQNNLKHMKWLTERISAGDFSQRASNFGEMSEAFNKMMADMRDTRLRLMELAQIDSLTKLANRRSVELFFSDAFSKAREGSFELCALMIDVDFFKMINDSYGHQGGDQALVEVASVMKYYFRSCDMLARYGGEEFVAVLPGCKLEDGIYVAERIRVGVERTAIRLEREKEIRLTVSIGASCLRASDRSFSDIIARCDEAMYIAKSKGRNQVHAIS